MTTLREAAQQALEAMGSVGADWICEASHHAERDQHKVGEPCPLQQRWHVAYQALRAALVEDAMQKFTDVSQEIEAALAEPVQEPVCAHGVGKTKCSFCSVEDKQPVQEPEPGEYHGWVLREVLFDNGEPVGHREPVQEPVAWTYEWKHRLHGGSLNVSRARWPESDLWIETPLYAAPPQRKPLPASEIVTMYDESPRGDSDMIAFARAIERAHGIT